MKELLALHEEIVAIYGYYVQVQTGVGEWHKLLKELVDTQRTNSSNIVYFGRGDPNSSDSRYQYVATIADLIDNSARTGRLSYIHRRSVIVFIVASWEDYYRGRIAQELRIERADVTSDVFRDLNKYRQAIVHARGILRANPKVILHFRRGDHVVLTDEHMDSIFRLIVDELNRLGRTLYNNEPGFKFNKGLSN